jgi:hypothetical protein
MGRIYFKNGDESQACVYSFVTGGTIENSFNANNGFSTEIHVFIDQAALDERQAVKSEGQVTVAGIGDSANFVRSVVSIASPDAEPTDQTNSVLTVYSGLKSYTYTISQPAVSSTFTEQTAQSALTTLAQRVSHKQ